MMGSTTTLFCKAYCWEPMYILTTKPMQRTAKARLQFEWVSPAMCIRGSTTGAGRRLGFHLGVLYRVESYGEVYACSALIGGVILLKFSNQPHVIQ
jgi:hypothetical protein